MKTQHEAGTTVRRRRALAVAGATAAAVLPWIAARATGVELAVDPGWLPPMVVGLPMVVPAALAASLAGWGTLALLERRTGRARQIWTAVAAVALLISLAPLPAVEAAAETRAYLALMHLAVGAVLIPGLAAGTRTRSWAQAHG
jgi:hypothetical protein